MLSPSRALEGRVARALQIRRTRARHAGAPHLESDALVAVTRVRARPPTYTLADLRRAYAAAGLDRLGIAIAHYPRDGATVVSLSLRDFRQLYRRGLALPRLSNDAACIACGCTDSRACPGGCAWLYVQRERGLGLCSTHIGEVRHA